MARIQKQLSQTFQEFFQSEKAGGIIIIMMTFVSLALANSPLGAGYREVWHIDAGGLSLEHWINDGLMAVFFLLIGLELERELYNGELSNVRNALLPIVAAFGGVALPAAIHFAFNTGSDTVAGIGIPMATDIAFALGVLALLGSRVPASLKIFLTALAVIDDLAAIILIALFYTQDPSLPYLLGAIGVFGLLLVLNRMHVTRLTPYVLGGMLMWFLMLQSGVHATITGVLVAFTIPFSAREDDAGSPSHRLEHALHKPVAFVILPLFALANTAIVIAPGWATELGSPNSLGIVFGLLIGKPLGITLLSLLAIAAGICRLPLDLGIRHIVGAGLLGGVGFTMSIFIANLAFPGEVELIDAAKIAILGSSLLAGILGFCWLKVFGYVDPSDTDADTMDFETDGRPPAKTSGTSAPIAGELPRPPRPDPCQTCTPPCMLISSPNRLFEDESMNPILRRSSFALLSLGALLALSACRTYPDYAADFHFPIERGDIAQGREAFVRVGCPQCHTVAGEALADYRGQRFISMPLGGEVYFAKSYGDLVTSIINPDHVISGVYLDQLPPEQRRQTNSTPMYTALDMKVTELVDIVAFLNARYSLLPGYATFYY